ncbi:MAG: CPBP family intramembrane metalloprotease [Candidatus Lokiarchaeota archaeon]|nr:CPBP family intramembrane metalloprotease [Candidatus Lokiarchaeota archaeon]
MERQNEDGGEGSVREPQRLSLAKHFQVVLGAAITLISFTLVVYLLSLQKISDPGDVLGSTVRYAALAGIEIVLVFCMQPLLVDKLIDGATNGLGERFRARAVQFGIRKPRNGRATARDALLLLFCALVPLDVLSYAIPGMLGYVSNSYVGSFFAGFTPEAFLTVGLAYNLITGVKEEFVFRGYFLQRFKEQGTRHTSWILTSLLFGLLHVQVFDLFVYPLGPFVWFATAFLVGLLFSGYALNANRLLPLVLAHGIGNFISAGAIWTYHAVGGLSAGALWEFLLLYYGPMVVAGIVLAIAFNKSIKRAFGAALRLGRALAGRASGRDVLVVLAALAALWLLSLFVVF